MWPPCRRAWLVPAGLYKMKGAEGFALLDKSDLDKLCMATGKLWRLWARVGLTSKR